MTRVGPVATAAASALCDQLGGLLRTRGTPLSDPEREPFDLAEDPPGELGRCGGATDGERYVVQRDVLVAEDAGRATVWMSVYEMPR